MREHQYILIDDNYAGFGGAQDAGKGNRKEYDRVFFPVMIPAVCCYADKGRRK